jgi:hypothetical protein
MSTYLHRDELSLGAMSQVFVWTTEDISYSNERQLDRERENNSNNNNNNNNKRPRAEAIASDNL